MTVGAYALDVIAGSPLTALSLLGPNPAIGVRFFGIGNELEATIAVLLPVGIGTGLVAWGGRWGAAGSDEASRRRAALTFLAVGLAATIVFAAGRFGADVGAALVFPVGAAVAAAVLISSGTGAAGPGGIRRRTVLLIAALPFAALAALALFDLAVGGGAHLTSSVLEAGGADDLADVAERRLRLSEKSFHRNTDEPYLYIAVFALALGVYQRRPIRGWFEGSEAAFAGLCGAAASVMLGTLVNDSGAIVLMIGTGFVLACTGFAWASRDRAPGAQKAALRNG